MIEKCRRHPIYRFLRFAYFAVLNPIKRAYFYLFQPETRGAKVVVTHQGKVLLVRPGYAHKRWTWPGGGAERGESFEAAAVREIYEETRIRLPGVSAIGEKFSTRNHNRDTTRYFTAESLDAHVIIDDQEIIDAGWFSRDALPEDRVPRVDEALAMYDEHLKRHA